MTKGRGWTLLDEGLIVAASFCPQTPPACQTNANLGCQTGPVCKTEAYYVTKALNECAKSQNVL
jgi:hypothetical protein